MQRPIIRLRDVVKRRSQGDSRFELRVPSLTVGAGQLVALVGESGCGKSTLLDLVSLMMEPSEAQRFELSPDPDGSPRDIAGLWARADESALAGLRRDYLGYILQTGGLLSFLSVRDNIALPCRIKGLDNSAVRINALAERMGILACLDRRPDALSIGQRQRAAILRAIVHRPRLLLADEPTAAVDKGRARAIFDAMQALARDEGVAVVLVTHDLDLVAGRADHTYGFDLEQVSEQETLAVCHLVAAPGSP